LIAVTLCAVGITLGRYLHGRPPYEVRKVRLGMNYDQVSSLFSEWPMVSGGAGGGNYSYQFDWGRLNVHFPLHDQACDEVSYYLETEQRWYESQPDGSFQPN
jgi:hypothetical protein